MKQQYIQNCVTLSFTQSLCIGCGACVRVCPHRVFSLASGVAQMDARDRCMECGACKMNCPTEAIDLKPGVGCAAAIIGGMLGKKSTCC